MLYGSKFLSFRQKLVKASEYSLCPIIDHFLYFKQVTFAKNNGELCYPCRAADLRVWMRRR